jgi:alanine dehydrogenase
MALADQGWETAVARDPALAAGVNVTAGGLTNAAVAAAHGLAYTALA